MRSQSTAPLLVAAFGIAVAGGIGINLLGKAAQSQPAAASSVPSNVSSGVITGATHSDVQPHSPNVMSAGNYHIEAQMDTTGKLVIYLYGQKERQLSPIPSTGMDLLMDAQAIIPGEDNVPVAMTPKPFPNEPKGCSSRFVGTFARRDDQQEVGLTLTLPIDNNTYRVQWRPENLRAGQFAPAVDGPMPVAVSSDAAKKLFLTPGGRYTQADIIANGSMTASQKYGNQMSAHNAHPQPGDRICPITDTVANQKFSWIVGGKTYLFCCPPCVEEFVKKAKEKPETIKAPEAYVQPG